MTLVVTVTVAAVVDMNSLCFVESWVPLLLNTILCTDSTIVLILQTRVGTWRKHASGPCWHHYQRVK